MTCISIVTVTKNSSKTIEKNIYSVKTQKNVCVEHLIKDAFSDDGTSELALKINPKINLIVSKDSGIYDAMNQGFSAASGDIIAFLNSDDYYIDDQVLFDVIKEFNSGNIDYVYGDINMVRKDGVILREWKTGIIEKKDMLRGFQIPHPAFFCKKELLMKIDAPFDARYRVSADMKQQLILLNTLNARGKYINRVLTVMALGGESTRGIGSYFLGWRESARAYQEVLGKNGWHFVFWKVVKKLKSIRAW
jgi:glycosyltransferase involved in cell wall biosynthesis